MKMQALIESLILNDLKGKRRFCVGGPEFFQTQMGRKFYESDVPEISRSLAKIAKHLEILTTGKEQREQQGQDVEDRKSVV